MRPDRSGQPDRRLIDISRNRPACLAEMAEVHGIIDAKLARYGRSFWK